jgi:hypothetical protein
LPRQGKHPPLFCGLRTATPCRVDHRPPDSTEIAVIIAYVASHRVRPRANSVSVDACMHADEGACRLKGACISGITASMHSLHWSPWGMYKTVIGGTRRIVCGKQIREVETGKRRVNNGASRVVFSNFTSSLFFPLLHALHHLVSSVPLGLSTHSNGSNCSYSADSHSSPTHLLLDSCPLSTVYSSLQY